MKKKFHVVVDFSRKCLKCRNCQAQQPITMEMPLPMFLSMAKIFGEIHAECQAPLSEAPDRL